MRWVIALFALSLSGCLLQSQEAAQCDGTSCTTCVEQAGCGWCGATRSCVPGSSFGTDMIGACTSASWRFASCDNPPGVVGDCAREDDCGDCLYVLGGGASDCAWCPSTGECVQSGERCTTGSALVDYDTCRIGDCRAQTACGACTSMGSSCRWCDQRGGSCTEGYGCDSYYEFSSRDACPSPNSCSSHSGCDSCVAEPGCGWCDAPSYGRCVPTTGSRNCSSSDLSTRC